jgi:hypothetical protein
MSERTDSMRLAYDRDIAAAAAGNVRWMTAAAAGNVRWMTAAAAGLGRPPAAGRPVARGSSSSVRDRFVARG